MNSITANHLDEQHEDAVDSEHPEDDDFPQGMLASPTRVQL